MLQTDNRGGMVVGPSHAEGGVHFKLQDTGRHIEEEGMEINIPKALTQSTEIYSFTGTNAAILNEILKLAGLSLSDKVTNVRSGDIVICVRSTWDTKEKNLRGTIQQILHKINTSNGCNPIISKKGGVLPKGIKARIKDWQTENPNSPRWKKKKQRIEELSNSIQGLRMNVSKDISSQDERTALTALIVAVMDRTAERIGNDDSADNGHFGVTGFRKKHISVVGNKVHLDYVGKSGKKHEKSFSDERIAKALKKAIKNSPGKFIFETSDGFRIKSDKVNRYLQPFKISAKDLRGYNANRWIIEKLKSEDAKLKIEDPEKAKKQRKKIFNKAVKETALRVGHGSGTLKKHYMIPELPNEYINNGRIIDMKNLGYYMEGSTINNNLNTMKTEQKQGKEKTISQANNFIEKLIQKGIPKAVIGQTDFENAPVKVYITIPYGKEGGGKYKRFKRFSEREIESAINFWKNPTKYEEGGMVKKSSVGDKEGWHFVVKPNFVSALYNTKEEAEEALEEYLSTGKFDYYGSAEMKEGGEIEDLIGKALWVNGSHDQYRPIIGINMISNDNIKVKTKLGGSDTANKEESYSLKELNDLMKGKKIRDGKIELITPSGSMEKGGNVNPQEKCICFSTFLKENNPEIVEDLLDNDINQNSELRKEVDEVYKAWQGGKM